jgi:glycosyltransferase involved in cell wall biosynthesis
MENSIDKFKALKVCVIIPTYNNAGTIAQVVSSVLNYVADVIVVNDGSADSTLDQLKEFSSVEVVSYKKNVGKGYALRTGFENALARGFDYAITLDSDGQHFANDLLQFLEKLQTHRESIIIGARNMDHSEVPGKSSFGNKFSNFWFRVETGMDLPDTQSGYRLYPLFLMRQMRFFTVKYEFEIEVLVHSAWKGIDITSVPVKVFYSPKETRVSHFRPFLDFTRISILNTLLVILTFLYISPRNFFRYIKKKNSEQHLSTSCLIRKSQIL